MITGRGLLLTPGLGHIQKVKVGDKIKILKPDKKSIESRISGITFNEQRSILVEKDLSKIDVPIGSEIWLLK